MRTPRKRPKRTSEGKDLGQTDRSDEAGPDDEVARQPKVTSHLMDMDLSAIKAHLRRILRKIRSSKGK